MPEMSNICVCVLRLHIESTSDHDVLHPWGLLTPAHNYPSLIAE